MQYRFSFSTQLTILTVSFSPAIAQASTMSLDEIAKMDYANQVNYLATLLKQSKETLSQIKQLTGSLQQLELDNPNLAKLGEGNESLKKALSEAKAAMEVHGAGSEEATSAWNVVGECIEQEECDVDSNYRYSAASLEAHHYYNAVMDTSLLKEAVDALETIEGLGNYVQVEKSRLDKMMIKPYLGCRVKTYGRQDPS